MALFGSRRGGEWWLKRSNAKWKLELAQRELKKNPSPKNKLKEQEKQRIFNDIDNNYYE